VVVVKGTFDVDRDGQLTLAEEQVPVARKAGWAGEPGESEMLHDSDLVFTKPTTDLLVQGQAHAPVGDEEPTVPVSLKVTREESVLVHREVTVEAGEPAGLGPVAPFAPPRAALAGTCDEAWRQLRAPLLPEDFDERFYLCAPEEQRPEEHLTGGEIVTLQNLCPEGALELTLPRAVLTFHTTFGPDGEVQKEPSSNRMRMREGRGARLARSEEGAYPKVRNRRVTPPGGMDRPSERAEYCGTATTHLARLYTVTVEPEERRVQMVWQTHLACHQKIYKLQKTVIRLLEDVDIAGGEDGQPVDLMDAQPTLPWLGKDKS